MKRIILIGTLMLFPVLVMGQQSGTYRDRYGNTTGSYQDNGNQRTGTATATHLGPVRGMVTGETIGTVQEIIPGQGIGTVTGMMINE